MFLKFVQGTGTRLPDCPERFYRLESDPVRPYFGR